MAEATRSDRVQCGFDSRSADQRSDRNRSSEFIAADIRATMMLHKAQSQKKSSE